MSIKRPKLALTMIIVGIVVFFVLYYGLFIMR